MFVKITLMLLFVLKKCDEALGDTVGNIDELVDWADKVKEAAIYPHLTKPLPSLDINKFLEDFGASGM